MASLARQPELRILHVLDRSIPNLSGYSIRSKYIIEGQAKMGLSPIVVSSPKYEREEAYEEISGISYYRSYSPPDDLERLLMGVPFAREQRIMRKLEKKIAEVVDKHDIDILHAHSPSLCGIPALRVSRKKGLPLVYEVRALWEDAAVDRTRFKEGSLKYLISRNVEQRLFTRADAIVCICEGLKSEIAKRRKRGNIFVVQNGVDTSVFRPREKAKHLIEKYSLAHKVVIGFIGSFFTFEGLTDLIESAPKVLANRQNVAFLIVGGGVEAENLKRQAGKLGVLDKAVIFTGRVPHEEIQDYYSIMDILVYPRISKRITELVTPLKPLEAMAMEKAVVASDVGGLKELVKNGETGIVFQAGDANDLSQKLTHLAVDEKRREAIGKSARVEVQARRGWSCIIKRYFEVYGSLREK